LLDLEKKHKKVIDGLLAKKDTLFHEVNNLENKLVSLKQNIEFMETENINKTEELKKRYKEEEKELNNKITNLEDMKKDIEIDINNKNKTKDSLTYTTIKLESKIKELEYSINNKQNTERLLIDLQREHKELQDKIVVIKDELKAKDKIKKDKDTEIL